MRILHLINSLDFGGAEKLLVDSLPLYQEKNLDVSLLLLNSKKTPFYNLLEKKGIKIINITPYKSLYNPLYIIKIMKVIKGYDIIHGHLFPTIYWLSMASFFVKAKKLVMTEHNTENRRRKILLFKYLDRFIYKRYHKIIAISSGTSLKLQKHLGSNFKNISIIENGINLNDIRKATAYDKSKFGFLESDKILIQVSSFTPQKDQITLIKTMVDMPNHIKLLLVGDGPTRSICEKKVDELNLNERVLLLGYRDDVPQLVKTADISILSSNYEGFGLAIVEGMAAGNPCLGTDVPGLREVIGESAIKFSVGDVNQLKIALQKLINDDEFFNLIAQKCLERSLEYDINYMIDKYIELYENIK